MFAALTNGNFLPSIGTGSRMLSSLKLEYFRIISKKYSKILFEPIDI